MNLSQIINQPSPMLVLALVVLLLVLLAVIYLVKSLLARNGKVKVEVNQKEVVEVATESLYHDKNMSEDILNLTQKGDELGSIIKDIQEEKKGLNIPKTDNPISYSNQEKQDS